MKMHELTGKQKRYLRSLGNKVKATVFIGQNGITDSVVRSVADSFNTSELVKIRLQEGFLEDRKTAGVELAQQVDAHLVQILGKTILVYKEDDENPSIEIPG